jgi:hypothetical protein
MGINLAVFYARFLPADDEIRFSVSAGGPVYEPVPC